MSLSDFIGELFLMRRTARSLLELSIALPKAMRVFYSRYELRADTLKSASIDFRAMCILIVPELAFRRLFGSILPFFGVRGSFCAVPLPYCTTFSAV